MTVPLSAMETGRGPAVVFLHGLASFKELWREQLPAIADAGFRAMALDLRGHGDSPMTTPPWTIFDMADDVLTCLDHHGVRRAALVGHSLGGRVMFQLAIAHPERIWAVVPVGAHSEAPAEPYRTVLKQLREQTTIGGLEAFREGFQVAGEIPERVQRDPAYGAWYWKRFARNRFDALVSALDAVLGMPRLTPRLREIVVPALAVVGTRDRPFLDLAARYAKLMPDCRTTTIRDCGHYPMVDATTEFTELLRDFLLEARPLMPADGE